MQAHHCIILARSNRRSSGITKLPLFVVDRSAVGDFNETQFVTNAIQQQPRYYCNHVVRLTTGCQCVWLASITVFNWTTCSPNAVKRAGPTDPRVRYAATEYVTPHGVWRLDWNSQLFYINIVEATPTDNGRRWCLPLCAALPFIHQPSPGTALVAGDPTDMAFSGCHPLQ